MHINRILNTWFFLSLVLVILTLVVAFANYESVRFSVFFINLLSLIGFYLIVQNSLINHNNTYYSSGRLLRTLFWYSLAFVLAYNFLYYYVNNNFFEFSARDSLSYDEWAKWMVKGGNIFTGISKYLKYGFPIDDLGAATITSLAYIFYPSTLMFNFFNVAAGIVTAASIYRISLNFTNKKYAYLTALTYGLSSFVIYLYSTGMKETFFAMIVVLTFERVLLYLKKKSLMQLIILFAFGFLIYFFRPAVLIMIVISVFSGVLLSKRKNIYTYLLLLIISIMFFSFYSNILVSIKSISVDSDIVAQRQNLDTSLFNYLAALASAIFGPLPTYLPVIDREQQAFYSIGLGFRVFLTIFFLWGLVKIRTEGNPFLIAIGIFTLLEILSLALILESFELRLNSPHLPFVYIIAFYFMFKYNNIIMKPRVKKIITSSIFVSSIIIIIWNLRF